MRKEKVKKDNQVGASKPLWTIKTQWEKKDGAREGKLSRWKGKKEYVGVVGGNEKMIEYCEIKFG